MADKVLVNPAAAESRDKGPRRLRESPDEGWKWIGWLGLLLTVVGLGDFLLAWYPLRFGAPEWEFGTVASTFAGLPLVSLGFAGMLASGVARGKALLVRVMAWGLFVFAALILVVYVVFLLDVPIALRAVQGVAALGIKKAVVKTTMLGVVFSAGYLAAAVAALRYLKTQNRVSL